MKGLRIEPADGVLTFLVLAFLPAGVAATEVVEPVWVDSRAPRWS